MEDKDLACLGFKVILKKDSESLYYLEYEKFLNLGEETRISLISKWEVLAGIFGVTIVCK